MRRQATKWPPARTRRANGAPPAAITAGPIPAGKPGRLRCSDRPGRASSSHPTVAPPRPTSQCCRGCVYGLREVGQVPVVDQPTVELVGKLGKRLGPGGTLRQDLTSISLMMVTGTSTSTSRSTCSLDASPEEAARRCSQARWRHELEHQDGTRPTGRTVVFDPHQVHETVVGRAFWRR